MGLSGPIIFYFSLEGAGQCQRDGTKCKHFARNEVRSPKPEIKLRFLGSGRNCFARNEVRSPKTEVKLRFHGSGGNPFARNEVQSLKTALRIRY